LAGRATQRDDVFTYAVRLQQRALDAEYSVGLEPSNEMSSAMSNDN